MLLMEQQASKALPNIKKKTTDCSKCRVLQCELIIVQTMSLNFKSVCEKVDTWYNLRGQVASNGSYVIAASLKGIRSNNSISSLFSP